MLPGLKNAGLEKCSHCMVGKRTRVSFKKHPPSRKSELLELVHSDVCDPLKVKSFSGALYFVTFIDDCLAKKDMLPGLKNADLEKCSHCMVGKQTRVSFKKHPSSRKFELLELVHSDVCGPLKVKSISGVLYLVTFIDYYSRKLWVYVLKTKDQVLEKFKEFHVLVERQLGKKLKRICTDNGGEYCGPFDVYCK